MENCPGCGATIRRTAWAARSSAGNIAYAPDASVSIRPIDVLGDVGWRRYGKDLPGAPFERNKGRHRGPPITVHHCVPSRCRSAARFVRRHRAENLITARPKIPQGIHMHMINSDTATAARRTLMQGRQLFVGRQKKTPPGCYRGAPSLISQVVVPLASLPLDLSPLLSDQHEPCHTAMSGSFLSFSPTL